MSIAGPRPLSAVQARTAPAVAARGSNLHVEDDVAYLALGERGDLGGVLLAVFGKDEVGIKCSSKTRTFMNEKAWLLKIPRT